MVSTGTIESARYPNVDALRRESKDAGGPSVGRAKGRVTKSTAIGKCDLAAEERSAPERYEPSRTSVRPVGCVCETR